MRGPLQGCEVDKEHEDLTWLWGGEDQTRLISSQDHHRSMVELELSSLFSLKYLFSLTDMCQVLKSLAESYLHDFTKP